MLVCLFVGVVFHGVWVGDCVLIRWLVCLLQGGREVGYVMLWVVKLGVSSG